MFNIKLSDSDVSPAPPDGPEQGWSNQTEKRGSPEFSVSGMREVGTERFSTVTRAGEGAGLGRISPI